MEQIEIRISGAGDAKEIAAALRQVAEGIEKGEHLESPRWKVSGKTTWEDATLLTEISEEE